MLSGWGGSPASDNGRPDPRCTLIEELEVPGKPAHLRRLRPAEKLEAIEAQAAHLQKMSTSLWRGVDMPEILAGSIWRSSLTNRDVNAMFSAAKKEADLALPVANWLRNQGLKVYAEVPMGTKRPDLIGFKEGGWLSSTRLVSVELKNECGQLKRGLDQMTTFGEYSRHVYLACTPAMAAEYLNAHASSRSVRHWDPEVLNNKLREFGFGLLLVMSGSGGPFAIEVLGPREREPKAVKVTEVIEVLKTRPPYG